MYKHKYLLLICIALFASFARAQNMKEGFAYLEKGNFAQAETFFKTVLQSYPENKTARLCFARATGLNGQPEYALQLLDGLGKDYPGDFEIRLNYAEALLWNKNYSLAESYYAELLEIDEASFPAVLGFANTLSSLKKYKQSIVYVNKALELSPGNQNAQVSKKYIQFGLAGEHLKEREYEKSVEILNDNLRMFPNDKETLLNLANTYIIAGNNAKAKEVYNQLKTIDGGKIQAELGLSLIAHLNKEEKEALELSTVLHDDSTVAEDSILHVQVKQRYVQALIWNNRFTEAETYLDDLPNAIQNQNWVLGLYAMLNVYKRDFYKSIELYKQMLKNDSSSFDGNLGLANAYKAVDKYDEAYKMALETLTHYENQKDALQFIEQLEYMFYPNLSTVLKYGFDNGDNESYSVSNKVVYPITSKFALNGTHQYRYTFNDITSYKAHVNVVDAGLSYRVRNNILLNANLGVNIIGMDTNKYNQLQAKLAFDIKPLKFQQLTVGYLRELESFNAELINRRITKDVFFLNHNLNTNIRLGWFNQYFYTSQNDGNVRHLYFTSVYYNLLKQPTVKVGVNYQYITFSQQRPAIYFSPEKFNMAEVFAEVRKGEDPTKEKGWSYGALAATGYQYIEDEQRQATYRFKLELGYKVSKRFSGGVYYQKSNIASGNSGGFSYSEVGLTLKWILAERSVFTQIKNED